MKKKDRFSLKMNLTGTINQDFWKYLWMSL